MRIRRFLFYVEATGAVVAFVFGILWLRNPSGPYEPITFLALLIGGTIVEIVRRQVPPPPTEKKEPPITEPVTPPPPTPLPEDEVRSSTRTLKGKVDLGSRTDREIRVVYSEPFSIRPNLETWVESTYNNKVGIEAETEFGFTIVKPLLWTSGSGIDIVHWQATGPR